MARAKKWLKRIELESGYVVGAGKHKEFQGQMTPTIIDSKLAPQIKNGNYKLILERIDKPR